MRLDYVRPRGLSTASLANLIYPSLRIAVTGLTRAARNAGAKLAPMATAASTTPTAAKVSGSSGLIWKSIHRRIVLGVTNIPEDQPPRPETPPKIIPMESEHDMGYPPVDMSAIDVE
jgi:hypothetical protein